MYHVRRPLQAGDPGNVGHYRLIGRLGEGGRMTTAGLVVGAYSYMSPEQVAGEAAGPAIYGVAFSPDGHSMAATSNTGDALVWDTKWLSQA